SVREGGAGGRVTSGLIAFYTFDEATGFVARDTSGVDPPLDLQIPQTASVKWAPGALVFGGPTLVESAAAATKILSRCAASGEITLEAWFKYGALPGFCRVVDVAASGDVGNASMTSDATTVGFDLRTDGDMYHRHTVPVFDAGSNGRLAHLVETHATDGTTRI